MVEADLITTVIVVTLLIGDMISKIMASTLITITTVVILDEDLQHLCGWVARVRGLLTKSHPLDPRHQARVRVPCW